MLGCSMLQTSLCYGRQGGIPTDLDHPEPVSESFSKQDRQVLSVNFPEEILGFVVPFKVDADLRTSPYSVPRAPSAAHRPQSARYATPNAVRDSFISGNGGDCDKT